MDVTQIVIEAPVTAVWAVVDDSSQMPAWCPFMVKDTTGAKERLGATRECTLESGGRRGRVFERCIEYQPQRRIMWIMERDTLGITRLLDGFCFGFALDPEGARRTRVSFEARYTARTWLARVLLPLVMRRQMAATNQRLLEHLKSFVERGDRGAAE